MIKGLFESTSRLADILSQQSEDKSLLLCISVAAVEKPGRSVIVISL